MALDCGEFVFVHIPRTAGKWTRAILKPYKVAEVGEFHGKPDILEVNKTYFCWHRNSTDWIRSIEAYLDRPSSWWNKIQKVDSTWKLIKDKQISLDPRAFRLWLLDDFLMQSFYDTGIDIVPFEQHLEYLSRWIDYNRLMEFEGVRVP